MRTQLDEIRREKFIEIFDKFNKDIEFIVDKTNIDKTTIYSYMWELDNKNRRKISDGKARQIENSLNLPPLSLDGKADLVANNSIDLKFICIKPSAGNGILILEEPEIKTYSIDEKTINRYKVKPEYASVYEIQGDSMSPEINSFDKVLVTSQDISVILDNRIYIFCLNEEYFIKKLFKIPGTANYRAVSVNPAYGEFIIDIEKMKFKPVGRLVTIIDKCL